MHALLALLFAAALGAPSRPAAPECRWQTLSDKRLGFDAWVQRCTLHDETSYFDVQGDALMMHYTHGETPEKVIEFIDLKPGETPQEAMRRFFDAHTEKNLAKRCVLVKFPEETAPPAYAKRYQFSPNAAYRKEIDARHEDGIPDPPCGNYGEMPDAVEYWEAQEGAHHVIYVHAGQDDPLFDEKTLRLH